MSNIVIAALYKFVVLDGFRVLRSSLLEVCQKNKIKGTLLLAREGINGTIAGTREGIDAIKDYLAKDERFNGLEYKESFSSFMPFYRLKVRLKKEIVTLGLPHVDPTQRVGVYVEPEDWNKLIEDPDVILIDVRNSYETDIGTFKHAITPETHSFREFPHFVEKKLHHHKNKKIAMCCTGGIRCEKASSYMLEAGFKEVYHLKGGILRYLEKVEPSESLWQGECFVFDQRTAVKDGLKVGDFATCYACRYPLSPEDRVSIYFEEGVSCPHCYESLTPKQKQRFAERQRQYRLASQKGLSHLGG
jgi:UPF0176 protein